MRKIQEEEAKEASFPNCSTPSQRGESIAITRDGQEIRRHSSGRGNDSLDSEDPKES